jgi:hypothetical protein
MMWVLDKLKSKRIPICASTTVQFALGSVRSPCSLPLKIQVPRHLFLALETTITTDLMASFTVLAEMVSWTRSLGAWDMDNARLLPIY